jgi:hypothetical protein
MTQPLSHGYPDYGRVASRAAKIFVDVNNVTLNSEVSYGPFFVGDIPHLAYVLDVFDTTVEFVAEYYTTSALGGFLGDQRLSVGVDGGFDLSLPVQGPWVFFAITPISATGSFDFKAYEVGGPLSNLRGSANSAILASFSGPVAAGATSTTTVNRAHPGSAHWFWQTDSPVWSARINALSPSGAGFRIDGHTGQAAGSVGRQIFLPPMAIELQVVNQDVAQRTFVGALVARPLEPGR